MGHMGNKNELLTGLRERLDQNPIGLPEDINIYEILSILFTDDEATLASKFPLKPSSFEDLKEISLLSSQKLKSIIASMLSKGLLLESKKHGSPRYMLSMALVGFFEFTFMKTNNSLPMKHLAELIHEYRLGTKFTKELFNPNTPRARSLLYETIVPDIKTEVLTHELATELVKEAGRGGLTKCYCRHETHHMGYNPCFPIDDMCISLGAASDFLIDKGFARKASATEILEKLDMAKELGLMHVCDNVKENVAFVCNCCNCCCCFLAGVNEHTLKNAVTSTNFIAKVDEGKCNGCEICTNYCQIKNISIIDNKVASVDKTSCLGCGVCASFCDQDAIEMKKREKNVILPKNMSELMIRLKQDRNK